MYLPLLIILALFSSCSRKAENKPLMDATVSLGPTKADAILEMNSLGSSLTREDLSLQTVLSTADYLRFAEDLHVLGETKNRKSLKIFAKNLYRGYEQKPVPKQKISASLYTKALVGEGEGLAQEGLLNLQDELGRAAQKLSLSLDRSKKDFLWPKELKTFPQALASLDKFALWLIDEIPNLGLKKEIASALKKAANNEYQIYRPILVDYSNRLQGAKTLAQALEVLREAAAKFNIKIDGKLKSELRKGEELAASLESMDSPQDTLELIVRIWRMMPPGERQAVFQKTSPDIYKFLSEADQSSLDCLSEEVCINLFLELAKRMVIIPKISEFGVDRIRKSIDLAARDQLIRGLLRKGTEQLPEIPDLVKEKVLTEVGKYQNLIALIQKDFRGFAEKSIKNWEQQNFPHLTRGLEPSSVKIRVKGSQDIQVALPKETGGGIRSGSEVLGVSLATSPLFLPEENPQKMQAALLEPILKLLAITGFRQAGGSTFPSLLYPIDGEPTEVFQVRDLLKGKTTFAVPDHFSSAQMQLNRAKVNKDVSVGAQAELLRGLSKQIAMHRDWEPTIFDEHLGKIQIGSMIKEIPSGAIQHSAFPKEIVMVLAVGGAGAILQNIIRDLSPAFLILPDGRILWGNQYKQIGESPANTSTLAGLVGIENGVRSKVVKTGEMARYILALDAFQEATEGIENTKAPLLLAKDAEGATVISQLMEAKRYLRLVQMALTNYLVKVAQNKSGGFTASQTFEGISEAPVTYSLEDQTLVIRALLASAARLDLKLFTWAALDSFYFLNKNFWDPEHKFYATSYSEKSGKSGKASIKEIASTLRALEELTPYLAKKSLAQKETISGFWLRTLEDF